MLFQLAAKGFSACCCGGVNSVQAGFDTAVLAVGLLAAACGPEETAGD